MHDLTAIEGLVGGLLIGAAATALLLLNGRIAGISGILGGALGARGGELAWRVAFLAGLVAGPLAMVHVFAIPVTVRVETALPVLAVAGFLVGFGTRLGGGCTSGHGVCGIARGGRRSIIATVTFIATAAITVFVVRHVVGG